MSGTYWVALGEGGRDERAWEVGALIEALDGSQ